MTTKICKTCVIELELVNFNKRVSTKDGLSGVCRDCCNTRRHITRGRNKNPVFCVGCQSLIDSPSKRQKYCTSSCRRKNHVREKIAYCIMCQRNEKYRHMSYCLFCLRASRHSLTYEDVENIFISQYYVCLVCFKDLNEYYNIDHDHKCCPWSKNNGRSCGRCVRGILHRTCNLDIGRFKDNPEQLRRAADYIEKYSV